VSRYIRSCFDYYDGDGYFDSLNITVLTSTDDDDSSDDDDDDDVVVYVSEAAVEDRTEILRELSEPVYHLSLFFPNWSSQSD
jgi:hypothetical protein